MKLRIPNMLHLRVSYLFLLILLVIFFIPVNHKVHCLPLLYPENCPYEKVFLGTLFFSHVFYLIFQFLTLEWDILTGEFLRVIFYTIFFLFMLNSSTNFLLKTKISELFPAFLKKQKTLTLNILPNKKFALNACVLVISILLSLFVLEILFKIYLPQKLSITGGEDLHFPHNTLGWFTKPNLSTQIVGENLYLTNIKHNSLGLRSDRELGEKTKKRILLFGDSFIYGLGLDWNETLDYFFQKELGENFQVINAGVTGYGMLQEYLLFKELYDKINPDLIIIAIYSNDFKDNIFPKLTGSVRPIATKGLNFSIVEKINQFGGGLDVVKRKNEYFFVFSKIFENLREFFKRHSNFYQFLYKNRFKFTQIKEESYRGDFSFFTNKQNEITNFAFSTECKLSEIFTSLAKEKSTKYLFLYIPSRLEIEENTVRPTFDGYYDLSMNELNLNRIINELHNCFEKNNETNFLSLKDKFLEEKTGMYNTHGNHWSPKATNLTAQLLKEELFKRGLINISEIKSS